jgi:hypothetical protein
VVDHDHPVTQIKHYVSPALPAERFNFRDDELLAELADSLAPRGSRAVRLSPGRANTCGKAQQPRADHCNPPAGTDARPSRKPPAIAKTVDVRTNTTRGMVSSNSPNRTPVWLA